MGYDFGHILSLRAITLGEGSVHKKDWPVIRLHLQGCDECKARVAQLVEKPYMRSFHEFMHPTRIELLAYACPEDTLEGERLSAEREEEIRTHLSFCALCQETHAQAVELR